MSMSADPGTHLKRQANYYWRVLASGLGFAVFGVAGLIAGLLGIPVLLLCVPDRTRQQAIARRAVQRFFQLFIRMTVALGVLTWSVENPEPLRRRGALIVANHPSLLDVVFLVSLIPDACCIVKQSLFSNPVMRGALTAGGYIGNDDPMQMLEGATMNLAQGSPVVMFPEGTRTEPNQPPQFGRGAANLSVRSGNPITPVFIRCEPTTLTRNERWYQVPYKPMHYTITVGPACPAIDATRFAAPVSILVRRQQERVMEFFNRMVDTHRRDTSTTTP